jgi:hypothetical protein
MPIQISGFDDDARVRHELDVLGVPSLSYLLGRTGALWLPSGEPLQNSPGSADCLLTFSSTDFRPYLEYQTPKGNALPYKYRSSESPICPWSEPADAPAGPRHPRPAFGE